ncbi:glycosyl transferase family 90-domain-containing protein [Chytriomyces cf. hyalinus JEL632]|nr:glycosyl transferase family 90-domain-containing protein [Chytriomyces cf. hyalinus JEL632]
MQNKARFFANIKLLALPVFGFVIIATRVWHGNHLSQQFATFQKPLTLELSNLIPAESLREWKQFATDNACSSDPNSQEYAQIHRDFRQFEHDRIAASLISPVTLCPQMSPASNQNAPYTSLHSHPYIHPPCIDENGVELVSFATFQNGSFSPQQSTHFLQPIAHLLPASASFQFAISRTDYPVALPSAMTENKFYSSIDDAVASSSCLAVAAAENPGHGFFERPFRFHMINAKIPIFSRAKLASPCFADILIPGEYHFHEAYRWESVQDPCPWDRKSKVLFWRGSTTGCRYSPPFNISSKQMLSCHRSNLLVWEREFTRKFPHRVVNATTADYRSSPALKDSYAWSHVKSPLILVDIGIYTVTNVPDEKSMSAFARLFPLRPYVSYKEQLRFRYHLVTDGNTWPGRLMGYLATNSVILYAGIFGDYWMQALMPWVHYIPVRIDLEDLEDRIQWLEANDDEARQISENARELVRGLNRVRAMQCYVGLAMLTYSSLYDSV